MSVAMELCRFACLTYQHRELLRPRFPRSQRSRVCSGGDAYVHFTLQEWGHRVWIPAMPSSELVEDEPRGTSPCRGLVVVAVSRVWKVASLWGWGVVVGVMLLKVWNLQSPACPAYSGISRFLWPLWIFPNSTPSTASRSLCLELLCLA